MTKKTFGLMAACLLTFLSGPAEAGPCKGPDHCSEYLVRFSRRSTAASVDRVLKENGLAIAAQMSDGKTYHLLGDPEQSAETLKRLNEDPDVVYAEPNYEIQINALPNDPDFGLLWALNNTGQRGTLGSDIGMDEAWNELTGSSRLVVAVLDTGVDYGHPDLQDNMWTNRGETPGNGIDDDANGYVDDFYGYNFRTDLGDPMDDHFHGTHVAGTIGAVGDNGIGIAGVNWDVRLMALKFLGSDGKGSLSDAIQAIHYAIEHGAKIINNSWSFRTSGGLPTDPLLEPVQSLRDAIAKADQAGVVFVCSAGNEALNNDLYPSYPASYSVANVVSVAATDATDVLAGFSNYGPTTVDLGAPGSVIYSTFPRWRLTPPYKYLSGTSMSSPHVSGGAALLWAAEPTLTHRQVIERLKQGVQPLPTLSGKTVTGGRLDVAQSLILGAPGINHPPVANAGPDQLRKIGDTVLLQGRATDTDGDSPLNYFWKLTPPTSSRTTLAGAQSATASFLADVAGTYIARLTVWDGRDISLPDLAYIYVKSDTAALTLDGLKHTPEPGFFTAVIKALREDETEVNVGSGSEIQVGETVSLDGTGSSVEGDEDAGYDYEWVFIERPAGSESVMEGSDRDVASFQPDLEGRYTVRLTVYSGKLIAESEISFQAKTETSGDDAEPFEPSAGAGGCSLRAL